jgi:hypothetical protein
VFKEKALIACPGKAVLRGNLAVITDPYQMG